MTSRRARPDTTAAAPSRRGILARLWSVVFWTAEAALAAPVLIGVLAWWLRPGPFWWAQIVAVFLPYAAWALAGWTAVVVLDRRWRLVLGHALLLGAVLWRAAPLAPGPAAADALAGDEVLRLVTFNVPQVGPSREALGDSMVAFVRDAEPHVLALQDSWLFESTPARPIERAIQVEAVERALPYRARLPDRLDEAHNWRRTGTAVPLLMHRDLTVHALEALPIGLDTPDVTSFATRAEIEWQGRRLALYNTHLRSFGEDKPWQNAALREGSIRDRLRAAVPYLRHYRSVYAARSIEADSLARLVAADSLPAVIVGDLNSAPDNWNARRLRTAGTPRTDAHLARGRGRGRTYPSGDPLVRIDVAYVDPALEVLSADADAVGFSDHRPLRVWLRWRDGG